MNAKTRMLELIKSHESIVDEYGLTFKHDFEIKQGVTADLAIFMGDRKLLLLNYIDSLSIDLPKVHSGNKHDFWNTNFDFWCLYDTQYFHLTYVQVNRAFDEHIIPFKTFLFRISNDLI